MRSNVYLKNFTLPNNGNASTSVYERVKPQLYMVPFGCVRNPLWLLCFAADVPLMMLNGSGKC